MKKYLLAFFICLTTAYSQKKALDSLDIHTEGYDIRIDDLVLMLSNADDIDVPVKFTLFAPDSIYKKSGINIKKINRMILTAHVRSMYSCKNKYTFVPKKIYMWYYEKYNVWDISYTFTAQNDFGATKDGNVHTIFDLNGEKEISMYDLVMKEKEKEKIKQEEEKEKKRRSRQW